MMDLLLFVLVCLGSHRLWMKEEIFRPVHHWIRSNFYATYLLSKPLLCPPCSAFWVALFWACMQPLIAWPVIQQIYWALAAYPFLRIGVWLWGLDFTKSWRTTPAREDLPEPKAVGRKKEGGCSSCQQKEQALRAEHTRLLSFKRRIVIMTGLHDIYPGYSVATASIAQAKALAQDEANYVEFWARGKCPDPFAKEDRVVFRPVLPRSLEHDPQNIADSIRKNLVRLGNAVVITHDLKFVEGYAIFAKAIDLIGDLRGFTWYHTCHSRPQEPAHISDERRKAERHRYSLPDGEHYVLSLSNADVERFADHFAVQQNRVAYCPNAFDYAGWLDLSPEIISYAEKWGLFDASIVQVYPLDATRLQAKGVFFVAQVFKQLHQQGAAAKLVLVLSSAGDAKVRAEISALTDEEAVFATSEEMPATSHKGLGRKQVAQLMRLANLFVFPSKSEACPLSLIEASALNQRIYLPQQDWANSIDGGVHWIGQDETPEQLATRIRQKMALANHYRQRTNYAAVRTRLCHIIDTFPSHRRLVESA
jgi:glycosyltransferase involved in cell wall biosynthesis